MIKPFLDKWDSRWLVEKDIMLQRYVIKSAKVKKYVSCFCMYLTSAKYARGMRAEKNATKMGTGFSSHLKFFFLIQAI